MEQIFRLTLSSSELDLVEDAVYDLKDAYLDEGEDCPEYQALVHILDVISSLKYHL